MFEKRREIGNRKGVMGKALAVIIAVLVAVVFYLKINKDEGSNSSKAAGYLVVQGRDLIQTDFAGRSKKKLMAASDGNKIESAVQTPNGRTFVEFSRSGPTANSLIEPGAERVNREVVELIDGAQSQVIENRMLVSASPSGERLLLINMKDPSSISVFDLSKRQETILFYRTNYVREDDSVVGADELQDGSVQDLVDGLKSIVDVDAMPRWFDDNHVEMSVTQQSYLSKVRDRDTSLRRYSVDRLHALSEGTRIRQLPDRSIYVWGADGTGVVMEFATVEDEPKTSSLNFSWDVLDEFKPPFTATLKTSRLVGMFLVVEVPGNGREYFGVRNGTFERVPGDGTPVGYAAS